MRTTGPLATVALAAAALSGCAATAPADDPTGGTVFVEDSIAPGPFFGGDPQHQAVYGVDVSMWEGPLSQREMDCFWDSGVRHVVVGTQMADITREQLAMAVSRGMTVDAYVYLYWNTDMAAQVDAAFQATAGFPIGRMWLDIEEPPAGRGSKTMIDLVDQANTACRAHGLPCGIYTGPGFWKGAMGNTTQFSDVPLWYAEYNGRHTLSDWSTEHFGGWSAPVGKQWNDGPLCGLAADGDVIQVLTSPTVVVDRSPPPDDGQPPAAPTGLYPTDGSVVGYDYVKMMIATAPRATHYQLALEAWNGSTFHAYYTWTTVDPFLKTFPPTNAIYRFRARAQNAHGWGDWSGYATFEHGKYPGPRPGPTPTVDMATSGTPDLGHVASPDLEMKSPPPPPPDLGTVGSGAPTGLSPDGTTVTSASVALSCAPATGATSYQFAIEDLSNGNWASYYTYTASGPSQTFWPQIHGTTYRFRVRALENGAWSGWSTEASFDYP